MQTKSFNRVPYQNKSSISMSVYTIKNVQIPIYLHILLCHNFCCQVWLITFISALSITCLIIDFTNFSYCVQKLSALIRMLDWSIEIHYILYQKVKKQLFSPKILKWKTNPYETVNYLIQKNVLTSNSSQCIKLNSAFHLLKQEATIKN